MQEHVAAKGASYPHDHAYNNKFRIIRMPGERFSGISKADSWQKRYHIGRNV